MHWRDNFVKELYIVGLSGTAETTPPNSKELPHQRKSTARSTLPPGTSSKSRSTTAVLVGSARTTSRASTTYRSVPRFYGGPQLANIPSNNPDKNLPEIGDSCRLGLHGRSKEIHGSSSSDASVIGVNSLYSGRPHTVKTTQTDNIKDRSDGRTELCSLPTTSDGGRFNRRTQSRARSEPTSSSIKQNDFHPNLVIKPLKPKSDVTDVAECQQHNKGDVTVFAKMNQQYKLYDNRKEETPRKITTPRLFGSPRGSRPEEGFEQVLTMKSIYRSNDKPSQLTDIVQHVVDIEETDPSIHYVKNNHRNFVLDLRQLSRKHAERRNDLATIKAAEEANIAAHESAAASAKVPQQELSKEKLVNSWLEACPNDSPSIQKPVGRPVDQYNRGTLASRKQIVLNVPNIGEDAE